MSSRDPYEQGPLPAELPLGISAALLAVAVACMVGEFQDRWFLLPFFAVAALLALGVAVAMPGRPAVTQDERRADAAVH